MKQIYYAIQSILHGRGSNVTKVISLSLGLTIGILLFSQIAFELNYEKCYPEADRLVLVRGGGENVKTGEKGEGYDDSLFAPMAEAFRSDLSQWIENATVIFNFETLNVFKDGHKLKDVNYAYVDTCYFRTFGIKVLKGNPEELQRDYGRREGRKYHQHPGHLYGFGLHRHYAGTGDRKSTRLNSSHVSQSRMPSSA